MISTLQDDSFTLAINRGGWGDGSPKDRNQYSNGRLVPVAKSTGYATSPILPFYVAIPDTGDGDDDGEVETCQGKIPTKIKRRKRQAR